MLYDFHNFQPPSSNSEIFIQNEHYLLSLFPKPIL